MGDLGQRAALEGVLAGGREHHDRPPGEHVGLGPGALPRVHLRRRVPQRPGEPALGGRMRVQHPRDPEVDQPGTVGAQHHVAGLEVAVHHPGLVDRRQRGGDADPEPVQIVPGEPAARPVARAVDGVLQAQPVDVLADDVGPRRFQVHLEDPGGAERGDPLGGPRLGGHPLQFPGRLLRPVQHLDRHPAPVRSVGVVHHALAARAQPARRPELTDLLRISRLQPIRHSRPPVRFPLVINLWTSTGTVQNGAWFGRVFRSHGSKNEMLGRAVCLWGPYTTNGTQVIDIRLPALSGAVKSRHGQANTVGSPHVYGHEA
jgi:hypothetical protein